MATTHWFRWKLNCVQPHCKITSLDPTAAWLWLSGISPLPIPCIISAGDSLQINSFYFFISKDCQLTLTAIHSLSIAPQALYYTSVVICTTWIWPVLEFSSREKLHVTWVLEKKTGAFSCKFFLCYMSSRFIDIMLCKWQNNVAIY